MQTGSSPPQIESQKLAASCGRFAPLILAYHELDAAASLDLYRVSVQSFEMQLAMFSAECRPESSSPHHL